MKPLLLRLLAMALSFAAVVAAAGCEVHVNVLKASNSSPCEVAANPANTSRPDAVVGDGTPGSCTEDALNTALETGGGIRFRCGANPLTITVSAEKVISRDTVIDGGNTISLDGAGASRLFVLGAPGGSPVSLTQSDASTTEPDASGGAICSLGGRLVIARSVFDGNRAANGGAVAAIGTKFTILRSQLTNNQAVGQGTGEQGIGGALLVAQQGQSVGMCQVTLSGNQAATFGTAMHLQGFGGEPVTIEQAAILDNLSLDSDPPSGGPAVFLGILTARLSSVTVARNQGELNPGVWVNGGDQPRGRRRRRLPRHGCARPRAAGQVHPRRRRSRRHRRGLSFLRPVRCGRLRRALNRRFVGTELERMVARAQCRADGSRPEPSAISDVLHLHPQKSQMS